jgi:hypothetical protein
MTPFHCLCCGIASRTSLVCQSCRRYLSPDQETRLMKQWHTAVCEQAKQPDGTYKCFHCGDPFDRDMVCGDHWPHTKGARPDLRFDVKNGVCSCAECNTSGSRNRTPVKKDLCGKCKIRLPVYGDRCIVCANG